MFAQRMKELRQKGGCSQTDLAQNLGVSQSAVANWEGGSREPSHEMTRRIADWFGVTVDYLMGRSDDPKGGGATEEELRAALWGGEADLTPQEMDELWRDVKEYANYKAEQCRRKRQ